MDGMSKVTQETTRGVQDTAATIGKLADLSKRLTDAIGRFKLTKGQQPVQAAEAELPTLEGLPSLEDHVSTSDEEIKLGFIE
jgi:hypothetical protein